MNAVLGRRHWIPPGALIFAQTAHGVSWLFLGFIAAHDGVTVPSGAAIAWVHTVALGWLTMAALGILVHVVPGFTSVQWRHERIARFALVPFGLGIVLFIGGWFTSFPLVFAGALVIALSFTVYYTIAVVTLRHAGNAGRTEGAIGRALGMNLTFLLVVVFLGLAMAAALVDPRFAGVLARLPAIHANFAVYGWLTMLIYGVSARTVRPICGVRSRFAWIHIAVGSSVLFGPILIAIGVATDLTALAWIGAITLGTGAVCYSFDTIDVVRRATVPHRPPQAFIVASVVWLIVSMLLGLGLMLGRPWANAYVFAVLVGWVGQMVNAHALHIGVRLIATVVRGDDDETRPDALLDPRWSWLSFVCMQATVALGCYGLVFGIANAVIAAASFGLLGWLAVVTNAASAVKKARLPWRESEEPMHGRCG